MSRAIDPLTLPRLPPTHSSRVLALSWSGIATIGSAVLLLARTAVLSRLLPPQEFGLFGLVFFALGAVSTFTTPGLRNFLVVGRFSGPDEQTRFLDTSWTVDLIRGAGLALLTAAVAMPYASAILQPQVAPLLALGSVSLLIAGLASPGTVLLYRDMEQRPLAIVRLLSESASLVLTACIAWRWPTAWALAIGLNATLGFSAALSYWVHPYRPRLRFDRALFLRGMAQGRHLSLAVALTFVVTQVDNLIVGRVLGAAALGLYLFAYRLASLPVEQLHAVLSAVGPPVYAKLRADGPHALAKHLRSLLATTSVILCAGGLPVLLMRELVVRMVGGSHWGAAAPLLIPLMLLALLRCATIHMGTMLQSVERAELVARAKIAEAGFFVPLCVWLVNRFGLDGACWAGAAAYGLAITLRSWAITIVLPGEILAITYAWLRPTLAAITLAVIALLAERAGVSPVTTTAVAFAAFIALSPLLDPQIAGWLARRRGSKSGD